MSTSSQRSEASSSSTKRRARIVSRSDVLVLCRPCSKKHRAVSVRVTVERGCIQLQTVQRKISLFKFSLDATHDLKTVWVNDLLDDEYGDVRNCFAVLTPEHEYILQAVNHRTKIEWMQSVSVAVSQSLKFRGSYRPSNWSKLDDLRKWLAVREVDYTYRTHPLYKGASYSGKWNLAMPHICGSMKWPNGDCYEGEFQFGKFQGTGTRVWLSHAHRRSYTGSWADGSVQGHGEMIYTDLSLYSGWWNMGQRSGHGRLVLPGGYGFYVGAWERDRRNGYGILENTNKSERYLGMWRNDKQHGPGILVAQNKFYYSGNYENGEKKLFGSRHHGNSCVNQDDKWKPLFQSCSALLEQMVSVSHSSEPRPKSGCYSDTDSAVAMDFSDIGVSPDTEASCGTCHGGLREGDCVACRVEGFKSTDHPLGLLVNNLTLCFNESYSGVGCHSNLLPHAVGELCSITIRLHQLVKMHCPSLITIDENDLMGKPRSQLSLLLKSRKGLRKSSYKGSHGTDPCWLHPIILPSIYSTLIGLYNDHHRDDDKKLNEIISLLSEFPDEELCGLLDVEELYMDNGNRDDSSLCNPLTERCGVAVDILAGLTQYCTPQNKILCVKEVNDELIKFLDEQKETDTKIEDSTPISHAQDPLALLSCDQSPDLSPAHESQAKRKRVPTGLFSLIVIRTRLSNLCSEIQFIQDFAGTPLLAGRDGFLLGRLQDCHFQLQEVGSHVTQSQSHVTNKDGALTDSN